MEILTVATEWSSAHDQHVSKTRGYTKSYAMALAIAAVLSRTYPAKRTPERLAAAVNLLRSGGPGPNFNYPEFVDAEQDGVTLVQTNGVCMLEDPLFPQEGELVLESAVLADFLDRIVERRESPPYREKGHVFPDIEVPVLAAGPGAWKTYLRRGGRLSLAGHTAAEEPFAYVAAEVDGDWMWVDGASGTPVRPLGRIPGPAEKPEADAESDLERVVRLLGDIAVDSWDSYTQVADPSGALHDVAPLFERLSSTDRREVSTFFSDNERESLKSSVNGLCGRALTEKRLSYLSAAAMCLEIGLDDKPGGEGFVGMAVLHHTAVRLGARLGVVGGPGDPTFFPRFADRYQGFLDRNAEVDRRPERFGWIETQTNGRITFTRHRPETKLGKRRED